LGTDYDLLVMYLKNRNFKHRYFISNLKVPLRNDRVILDALIRPKRSNGADFFASTLCSGLGFWGGLLSQSFSIKKGES
jgi:hypothetical protein